MFNPAVKYLWTTLFSLFTKSYPDKNVSLINSGYADLTKPEGLMIDKAYHSFDKYRLQLYHYCVVNNG